MKRGTIMKFEIIVSLVATKDFIRYPDTVRPQAGVPGGAIDKPMQDEE